MTDPASAPAEVGHRMQARRGSLVFEVTAWGPPDGEPMVLLHGFPQRADSWELVAPLLARAGYRVLAPDQRGYSHRARPRGRRAYRMEELVADVLAVIDDCASGQPVHLVGHDWGAAIAWALAADHPDRVRDLTALSVPHPAAFLASFVTSAQAIRSWYMFLFQLPWLPERLARSGWAARWLHGGGQTAARARRDLARLTEPGAASGPFNYYRAMPLTRPAAARRPVRVPTLFVWSDRDVAIGRAAARRCRRWVRDTTYRLEILRGVGHWIPEEAPDETSALILAHIARG